MIRNRMEKRLRFENLEQKRVLAADLTVAVIDGDLVITGDAEPNSFYLRSGDHAGEQFEITQRGPLGDTINGQVVDELFVSGVTGNVVINTGGGDDVVRIFGGSNTNPLDLLLFPNDLIIDLGDGLDELYMGTSDSFTDSQLPLAIADDLVVNGGEGDDLFSVTAVQVVDNFTIVDSQGSNTLEMPLGLSFPDSNESTTVGDDFTIAMGGGDDLIFINQAEVEDNLIVMVEGGNDSVNSLLTNVSGSVLVDLGDGENGLNFALLDVGKALTVVGSGTNDIVLASVTANSLIAVVTTNGDDLITLQDCVTSKGVVTTGDGQDTVELIDSAFEMLSVMLGRGDDFLTLENVEVLKLALLNGGQGTDTLTELGDIDIHLELDLAFEDFTV